MVFLPISVLLSTGKRVHDLLLVASLVQLYMYGYPTTSFKSDHKLVFLIALFSESSVTLVLIDCITCAVIGLSKFNVYCSVVAFVFVGDGDGTILISVTDTLGLVFNFKRTRITFLNSSACTAVNTVLGGTLAGCTSFIDNAVDVS